MPQTIWITLEDPEQYEGITSAVQGLDGVSRVRDMREQVGPILGRSPCCSGSRSGTAALLVLAALLLVANTIRLAAFARRKEIGIMRLVGASTLYIALPFLLEALVTALIGVALAGRGAGGVPALRHRRASQRHAEVRAVDRLGRVLARRRSRRDPRSAADVAADTRVDAQIPQSLIRRRLASRRPARPGAGRTPFPASPTQRLPRCVPSPVPLIAAWPQLSLQSWRWASSAAHADDLKDKQSKVERELKGAHQDLDESSAQLRKAAARLDAAQEQLGVAKTRLATARGKVEVAARARRARCRPSWPQAEADLAAAEAALAQGQVDRERSASRSPAPSPTCTPRATPS